MRFMAERLGFVVLCTEFDSTEQSLIMSQNYRRDVPMTAARSPSRTEQRRGRRYAVALNDCGEADLGVFLLAPAAASALDSRTR